MLLPSPPPSPTLFEQSLGLILGYGWIVAVGLLLWIIWEIYKALKVFDYISSIEWAYLQITLPETAIQTPKSMENVFEVLGGIHKGPDVVERYFEGFLESWYSCELHCTQGRARYILVVPAAHRKFFEGVVYGQYPTAEITEVADYAQEFSWSNLEKTFDMYGTEIILTNDDIYPIKTYGEYEDALAEDERFIDPHQSLIESFTNLDEGEQFWVQVLVRPVSPNTVQKWADAGEKVINKLAGKKEERNPGLFGQLLQPIFTFPSDLFRVFAVGPIIPGEGGGTGEPLLKFPITSPADDEKMKGILVKTAHGAFKTKIRIIHLAPIGKLRKPNINRALGTFKQFNTFNLNSFMPDSTTRTNKPDYFLREFRRYQRKRRILLYYQWRDFWGVESGFMLSAEELSTIYHFPAKYFRAPAVERAKAGLGSAPENIPFA